MKTEVQSYSSVSKNIAAEMLTGALWIHKLTEMFWKDIFIPLKSLTLLHINHSRKKVFVCSAAGVLCLWKVINDTSCPQTLQVFSLSRQVVLMKLLKCYLITGSSLIHTSVFGVTTLCLWSVCVCVCVSVWYLIWWVKYVVAPCSHPHL